MRTYLEISITTPTPDATALAIAAMSDFDVEGMEESEGNLRVYFDQDKLNHAELLEALQEAGLQFTESIHEEKNWNEEWESGFTPVVIGDYAAIRANFHEPIIGVKHEIVITPKMSFGTGHHATTSMMIRMMQQIDLNEKSVLDYGTGTGVLAILAARSGASSVSAIDNDDWSIKNADENFKENNIEHIRLSKSDSLKNLGDFDVILANINLNVLTASAKGLIEILKPGGYLLLSGFYKNDVPQLLSHFTEENFKLLKQSEENNWNCLLLEKL